MITREDLTYTWGFQRGVPCFHSFQKELDSYVKSEIEKELNKLDCE